MKNLKKVLCVALAAACLFMTACQGGGAAKPKGDADATGKINIRVSHATGVDGPYDIGAQEFKRLIEEKSGGRITATVFASTLTTDEIEEAEMCQAGNLDMAFLFAGSIGGFAPIVNIFDLPFLFEDMDHINRVFDSEVGEKILQSISDVPGLVGLGFHEDGWRAVTTADKKIATLEDLKGTKIRVPVNEVCTDIYKALGAIPIALPSGEIYNSLQTGVVQGQDNGVLCANSVGYLELCKYVNFSRHYYSAGAVIGGEKFWDSLTPEDQKLIKECVKEAGVYQRKQCWDTETKLAEELAAQGKFELTYPKDLDKWEAAVQPVYEKYLGKNPEWKPIVEEIKALKDN
ncbi:MAG: TRAP transporter substrate-binding protein [Oscillospiraceae bacterium]